MKPPSKPEMLPEGPQDDAVVLEVIARNNNSCAVDRNTLNSLQEWARRQ